MTLQRPAVSATARPRKLARMHRSARNLIGIAMSVCAGLCPAADIPQPAPAMQAAALAQRINRDRACTQIRVIGPCLCGGVPCGMRIMMNVPVAFTETVQKPGDTLLGLAPELALRAAQLPASTGSSQRSALDHTAEVHAWSLGDAAWLMPAAAGGAHAACALCRPSDASMPAPPEPWPRLVYASEADVLQWRAGARDTLRMALQADLPPATLGAWGPLYPRQMRDLGTSELVHSAKSGYRALSLARELPGGFGAPVDLAGAMQQAFPAASTCFAVGVQPLPEPASSPMPVRAAADGRYGWFYWRPVSCCADPARAAACAAP